MEGNYLEALSEKDILISSNNWLAIIAKEFKRFNDREEYKSNLPKGWELDIPVKAKPLTSMPWSNQVELDNPKK